MKEGDTNTKMSSTRPQHQQGVTPVTTLNPPPPPPPPSPSSLSLLLPSSLEQYQRIHVRFHEGFNI